LRSSTGTRLAGFDTKATPTPQHPSGCLMIVVQRRSALEHSWQF
jgi:hypothetical protein